MPARASPYRIEVRRRAGTAAGWSPSKDGAGIGLRARDERRALEYVWRHGRDAVSFQALEHGMHHWFDAPAPEGTGACVAYRDTGTAWVGAGRPLAPEAELARAAARFAEAARRADRRASFFGAERPLPGFRALCVGEQPVLDPRRWLDGAARGRSLREQLRRARAKGVRVRRVDPGELREGAPLRAEVDALCARWLRARAMEPMGFLVALEPFHAPDEHRYFAAERGGRVVAFLSAVPIPARRGWLVEDVVRDPDAPNGTSESLLESLCRDVSDAALVTLGLAPLAGRRGPRWRHLASALGRPLYDFAGLRAFKARLHPSRWEPVFLLSPGETLSAQSILDALRAFAGGSLLRFGARSLLRHPAGAPWALSLVLAGWAAVLAGLAVADRAGILGFGRSTLAAWVVFDVVLSVLLFRFARRPRAGALVVGTVLAAADAGLSLAHLARTGLPAASWHVALRLVATVGPLAGALALAWATILRVRLRDGASR